ncbi:hypothetical protein BGZ51_000879 [Haplosporangium sp. Z 767]|nr:hypothetical protein BGZ51_000879 [Haplosporangium sp. Z 767]
MKASSPEQQQHHIKTQATSASTGADPQTLVLLTDPAMPSTQPAAAAGASLALPAANIATAAARPTPTFAGSGLFAAVQDPSKHLAQLPIETPYFTPQAAWTESRSDYFSSAATTPAVPGYGRITSPNPSQANLYTSGFSLPAQTPAAIEISSFSASSPSYFPSPTNPPRDLESQAFHLPPSTPFNRPNAMTLSSTTSAAVSQGSSNGLSALRTNLPISMPLSSLMSPPGSAQAKRLSMSALSQSHQSPAGVAAPAELNLKEMTGDMASQLLGQVLKAEGGDKTAVMLLDMRPSVSHAASSIKTAVSVCVPNMLLKRPMYSLQMVTEQLTTEQDIETFSKWKQFSNIVLFDAAGAAPLVGSPTFFLAQKFRKEGCSANLAYLHGGFNEFSVRYNELCRSDGRHASGGSSPQKLSMGDLSSSAPTHASSNPMSIVSPPRQRLHLGSLPSMMTQPPGPLGCQTPMIENPNVNPLFESVRQAMGLSTNITEEIPVRLPMGFSVETMQEYLPKWLLSAVTEESGKARLAEYFQV